MIGTVEALGVFLLAVLPGFAGLRAYSLGRPPLRARTALHELGLTVAWSFTAWTLLYPWRGADLLGVVLAGDVELGNGIDAFAELVVLAIGTGLVLALAARVCSALIRAYVTRDDPGSLVARSRAIGFRSALWARVRQRCVHELRNGAMPTDSWDRLLARLSNHRETVLCRVLTSDGHEILGVLADQGYADWDADGRDLLLMPEVVRSDGQLQALPTSRGVFVSGERIVSLSVVLLPEGALTFGGNG